VTGADQEVAPFTAIGLTFDAPPSGPVFARVKDAESRFGPWRELELEIDEGPDHPQNFGTEPLWVGDGTGYEVNLGRPDVDGADVVLVRQEQRRSVVDSIPAAGATVPFAVTGRDVWGARTNPSPSYASTVRLGVVHHSASSNAYSPADVPGILRSIQAYHMDGRGWSDIAYNFVVDKYGGIWEGRAGGLDRPVVGAHAMGFNTSSVGVMVIGDYSTAAPTGAALESAAKVVGWKLFLHQTDALDRVNFTSAGSTSIAAGVVVNLPVVVGHKDVGSTGCPGSIYSSLGWIRQRAHEWTQWFRAASVPAGSLDAVEVGAGTVTVSGWAKDLGSSSPALARLGVDGLITDQPTDRARPDVEAVYPTYGPTTGYSIVASGLSPGLHEVCVVVFSGGGAGSYADFGCRMVVLPDIPGTSPTGRISGALVVGSSVEISGSTADPDGPAPRTVAVELDRTTAATVTTGTDGTFNAKLDGVAVGAHRVCARVTNGGEGVETRVDCVQVAVAPPPAPPAPPAPVFPSRSPLGTIEVASGGRRSLSVSGWTLDPDLADPISVRVAVDGRTRTTVRSGWPRPDVAAFYPTFSGQRGFVAGVSMKRGRHTVCVTALNVGAGANTSLGCRSVVVK